MRRSAVARLRPQHTYPTKSPAPGTLLRFTHHNTTTLTGSSQNHWLAGWPSHSRRFFASLSLYLRLLHSPSNSSTRLNLFLSFLFSPRSFFPFLPTPLSSFLPLRITTNCLWSPQIRYLPSLLLLLVCFVALTTPVGIPPLPSFHSTAKVRHLPFCPFLSRHLRWLAYYILFQPMI